ncbi:MAG: 50S ribosomal protein L10 [Candidatus Harrisonbacteria bacterium RIFCSPLOWO2_02_FULL_41_13b]|uniref:Large ribosomal subunit protein uL10 n=1 Tax=Candidatus Harrisonbacteria bacterium RIFCSPLOWO2_02_FULL_41_13b TaxID=1798409 RepID=A0A1G1ZUT4_9BACT|nr:MAG: 50S ribosomal protein L10 [Candidatus Harrisonbacteria bacterium RIFCSPHIGHO2_02_FULL_40_20]OGY67510.1 MAG: 50S ribosomal protein L10 [Candidatus Harrisonbacteria bacterium RIFCSPLOWO2_02_FULL_41_13b]
MLTKAQKTKVISDTASYIKDSKNLVFADFSTVGTKDINKLKQELKKSGSKFRIAKKTLLKLALKDSGMDFDPLQFKAQVGVIYTKQDLSSIATPIYKFSKDLTKEKKNFQILGNYDLENKVFMTADEFTVIAKLPTKEILLAQVVGVMAGTIRAFMYIIDQLSKKSPELVAAPAAVAPVAEKTVEQNEVKNL